MTGNEDLHLQPHDTTRQKETTATRRVNIWKRSRSMLQRFILISLSSITDPLAKNSAEAGTQRRRKQIGLEEDAINTVINGDTEGSGDILPRMRKSRHIREAGKGVRSCRHQGLFQKRLFRLTEKIRLTYREQQHTLES